MRTIHAGLSYVVVLSFFFDVFIATAPKTTPGHSPVPVIHESFNASFDDSFAPEDCANGIDDDFDGLIDCQDPDCNPLPSGATTATYRTIANGSWTSSSTWQGGSIPPTGNISNRTISIEHDVVLSSGNITTTSNTELWVTNGSLMLTSGYLEVNKSTVTIANSDLSVLGSNDLRVDHPQAEFVMDGGALVVTKDVLVTQGILDVQNVCMTVDGNFTNEDDASLINVCLNTGTNPGSEMMNDVRANFYIEDSELNLINGSFVNSFLGTIEGDNVKFWVQNGDLINNGFWTPNITQYCISGTISIPAPFRPNSEECGTINWYFSNCDCSCIPQDEVCSGGIDEDGDGDFDCQDADCGGTLDAGDDQILCAGDSNGAIETTVTGGVQDYEFDWNVDALDDIQNPTSLSAGFYELIVTDDNGCQGTDPITLFDPPS